MWLRSFTLKRVLASFNLSLPRRPFSLSSTGKAFNFKCNVLIDAASHYYIQTSRCKWLACEERRFLSPAHRSLSATIYERGGTLVIFSRPACNTGRRDCGESRVYWSCFPRARLLLIFLVWITHGREVGLIFVACEGACLPWRQLLETEIMMMDSGEPALNSIIDHIFYLNWVYHSNQIKLINKQIVPKSKSRRID